MKKPKISLGEGGLKGLLVQHVEKMVFGIVLVLVAYFIYSSATQTGLPSQRNPLALQNEANGAVTNIKANNWASLEPTRRNKVGRYEDRVVEMTKPIEANPYASPVLLSGRIGGLSGRRGDPKMLAPENVIAEGGVFAIPQYVARPEDPFADDKDAVEKPKEEAKPPRRKEKPKTGDEYMAAMMGSGGAAPGPGPRGSSSSAKPGRRGGASSEIGSSSRAGGSSSTEYMMPAAGVPMGGAGMAKQLGPNWRKQYLRGSQPGPGYGGGMGGPSRVVGRTAVVVAVKALVPFERQWDEYERVLAEAQGYNAQQDMPRYLDFVAERAEVPEDPQAALQWKLVMHRGLALEEAKRFAGQVREVVDPNCCLPWVLTIPVPPVLMKSVDELGGHPEVPKSQVRPPVARKPQEGEEKPKEAAGDPTETAPELPKTQPGVGPPGMPMPGDMAAMMNPDYTGMGSAGGYPPGGSGSMMPPMYPPGGSGSSVPYGAEMQGSGTSGYPGMPGMAPGVAQPRVKYKLVRFFDFSAEQGKSYRYRVRVRLEDPNRPANPQVKPDKRILDPAVVKRLKEADDQDQEYAKNNPGKPPRRTYWIWTDWSEASNVVTVPKPIQYVAGTATAPRIIKLEQNGPQVQTADPSARLVTVVWDTKRAVEVPGERQVYRGSVLNFTQNADVLQPMTLRIKTIEDHEFETDGFVADLRGGEPLIKETAGSGKSKSDQPDRILNAPGEYLVIDKDGNMLVRSEVSDIEEYRRLMFVEDHPVTTGAPTMGPGMMDGNYEMMMMGSGSMGPPPPPPGRGS